MHTVAIISGSSRADSKSLKVANRLGRILADLHPHIGVDIVDLADAQLPMWDEQLWALGAPGWNSAWAGISKIVKRASGVVVISPGWGGMVPAALKNFFLLCDTEDRAHKPGLIVTVSSGSTGSYPISELRMSSYKNTHICYIPDHLIIRHVDAYLRRAGSEIDKNDQQLRLHKRIEHALHVFVAYVDGMTDIRARILPRLKEQTYGI